jgi:hypothetical protein
MEERQETRTKQEAEGKRPSAKSYGGGGEARSEGQEQSKTREKGQEPSAKSQEPRPKTQDPRPKTQDPRDESREARPSKRQDARCKSKSKQEAQCQELRGRRRGGQDKCKGRQGTRGKRKKSERIKANARQHLSNYLRSGLLYVTYILFVTNKSFFERKRKPKQARPTEGKTKKPLAQKQ